MISTNDQTYDARCVTATTEQGLDPVVARLSAEGFPVQVNQTGGFTMVATVTDSRDGRVFGITYYGPGFLLCEYPSMAFANGEEEHDYRTEVSLDEIVARLREHGVPSA